MKTLLNEKEFERFEQFRKEHYEMCGAYEYKLTITYTGIGPGFEVKCKSCKQKRDITDYDCW